MTLGTLMGLFVLSLRNLATPLEGSLPPASISGGRILASTLSRRRMIRQPLSESLPFLRCWSIHHQESCSIHERHNSRIYRGHSIPKRTNVSLVTWLNQSKPDVGLRILIQQPRCSKNSIWKWIFRFSADPNH